MGIERKGNVMKISTARAMERKIQVNTPDAYSAVLSVKEAEQLVSVLTAALAEARGALSSEPARCPTCGQQETE